MSRSRVAPLVLAALSCLSALGCSALDLGNKGSDSSSDSSASSVASDGGAPAVFTGQTCGQDPASGIVLCASISACPGLVVDHDVYPDCGFRVGPQGTTSRVDLECVCSGQLCPIGVPNTCAQVTTLLQAQTQTSVCTQISEGRCLPLPTQAGSTSTCDQTCASECGGNPTCLQGCGC